MKAKILLVALFGLTGCVIRYQEGGFRASLLQSDYAMEFVDVDGTNFASTLDLAAFSKLDSDIAELGYKWDPQTGEISVGRAVTNLDQTPQIAAAQGLVEAAVKGAVEAFLGQLRINREADLALEALRRPTEPTEGVRTHEPVDTSDVSAIIGHPHQTTDMNHASDGHTHPVGGPFHH